MNLPVRRPRRLLPTIGAEQDPREMSFLDHLEELRWVLVRSGIVVAVIMVGMWFASTWIYESVLMRPLFPLRDEIPGLMVIVLKPAGVFLALLNITLWSSVVVAVPYLTWELWRFVAPGLFRHERRMVPLVLGVTVLCFACGAALAYYVVLPYALRFFLGTWAELAQQQIEVRAYLSFAMRLILSFGVVFELPVVTYLLARLGLVTAAMMRRGRSMGYFIAAVGSAFITPPDPFTMLMLMGPLVLLYELSIVIALLAARKRSDAQKNPDENEAAAG